MRHNVSAVLLIGLRDYGTAEWEGGAAGCDHKNGPLASPKSTLQGYTSDQVKLAVGGMPFKDVCGKCGARRIDRQIGLEPSVEAYVAELVAVFREVKRVLRNDGTLWLNLGDSYAGYHGNKNAGDGPSPSDKNGYRENMRLSTVGGSFKSKDLIGVPWRVAFALQADGWWLRSEITWCKKAPMPESVRDRPTSATEKIFLLTKRPRYYYDAEAVKEENSSPEQLAHNLKYAKPYAAYDERTGQTGQPGNVNNVGIHARPGTTGRNMRNFWLLGPDPFPGAHFAVFPKELAERCVKAGTSEKGACPACGAPWARITERGEPVQQHWAPGTQEKVHIAQGPHGATSVMNTGFVTPRETTGWRPTCSCPEHEPVPCVTLDPFAGAGTVALVSDRLGRDSIAIELNPEYCAMMRKRITGDAPLFAQVVQQ